jgi:hypothetical protein
MKNLEQNRRRNQIVAERMQDKMNEQRPWVGWPDRKLWEAVEAGLNSAVRTHRYMGHLDKSAEAIVARGAASELRLRGVQTQLPV